MRDDFITNNLSEFVGAPCPVCSDIMRSDHDNYLPVWSDEYDNIVCWTCEKEVASR